ncbi:MAG TPA: exo-beta-N-acetylmuramidase NamZ domain-containing protein [Bryobacteraceae bacterium]
MPYTFALSVLALCWSAAALAQETFPGSAALDRRIEQAIRDGLIPGAVLVVGHEGTIVHRKAYGNRALVPAHEPMTIDTIFDVASLTKVVATTPAIMKLFEQGKIRLGDPITAYLPEFQNGQSAVTVRDLLTHFSGLRPDLDLTPPWSGYDTGIAKALHDKPAGPRGERFVYSDIDFELLGEIVRRVSGEPLEEFARKQIFEPLGMRDTMFRPPASLRARIAPTEIDAATGEPFRGVVHDPTARYMGGVAGHAGLFSTASDLARFAQMMLDRGQPIFSPLTVAEFTKPSSPPGQSVLRGLGWDIDSPYSAPRGELFPVGSYGHTGFTGTSMWIDPSSQTYVILLTNAVHPKAGKNLSPLRRSIGTMVAAAVGAPPNRRVETGLDVLEQQNFAPLRGKRVGLITNQTGIDYSGRRNVDAMREAGIDVVALFSAEHGINGNLDQPNIADSKDELTGLPVWSLYQNSRFRMTPEMLRGVDALVFDMQDVGARFYTYSCTMVSALERVAATKTPFYVLDRPNPITGMHVEGPLLDPDLVGSIGCYALPIRHGLTLGELATMANAEKKLGADLHVIKMKNWARGDWFDSTGLGWIDPSPNMRSLNAATLYPGVAMLEASGNLSVGRGTDAPFEQIGADWIRGVALAEYLNGRSIPGVRVYPTRFQPSDSVFKGKTIEGVRFVIVNREGFNSVRLGLEITFALNRLYPGTIDLERDRLLIGNRRTMDAMKAGTDPTMIERQLAEDVAAYLKRREPFLLY